MMNKRLIPNTDTEKTNEQAVKIFNPAVEVYQPSSIESPLIFTFPHSGRIYPLQLLDQTNLSLTDIRRSEDAFVDQLFPKTALPKASFIIAKFPRVWVDANRHPKDLDPEMFEQEALITNKLPSKNLAAGFGVIPKLVAPGLPIYSQKLALDEALKRLEGTHTPYHQAIEQAIAKVKPVFGFVIIVDCHSMPSSSVANTPDGTADIVLGDRYESSCDPKITDIMQELFYENSLKVAKNQPYAGGYSLLRHGRPMDNVHSIQIEISRNLYMDEENLQKTSGFIDLQLKLEKFMKQLELYAMTYSSIV
ncbi:MAG: N-formylglutamate amidohydrolase [Robiginitomaculum sp.]|nr:N-formylglutamate amidohydrolase [Robiginitomaculum sp.]